MTYLTTEQKETLRGEVLSIIQANLNADWKNILELAMENTGLPSILDFQEDGEEVCANTFDILYHEHYIDPVWSETEGESLRVMFSDEEWK